MPVTAVDVYVPDSCAMEKPVECGLAVVPSDTDDIPYVSRALYVGTAGDIMVALLKSTDPVLFKGVPKGSLLPVRVKRVYATGTTAADILAVW